MVESMDDSESLIADQVRRDNEHFKGLLDLIPPQAYFSKEDKDEIWGNTATDEEDTEVFGSKRKKKKKKKHQGSLSSYSVTQITELRQQGDILGSKKEKHQSQHTSTENGIDEGAKGSLEEKHKGKKQSRSAKASKHKGKELQKREARLEELREKLRKKLEEMKAQKSSGAAVNTQEQKRLKRQQKKVNAKLKGKGKNPELKQARAAAEALKSPPQNKIVNQNGMPVKSRFDFSVISFDNDKSSRSSDLHGRDYKRLLEKVEKRKEKVEKLKEQDVEKGRQLEEKMQWQTILGKAKGEKVKDDPNLLKKAAKKKEKVKERRGKKWEDRVKTTEDRQRKRQDKREANIKRRKDDNKEKKRKKMIKKGRIVPGF